MKPRQLLQAMAVAEIAAAVLTACQHAPPAVAALPQLDVVAFTPASEP